MDPFRRLIEPITGSARLLRAIRMLFALALVAAVALALPGASLAKGKSSGGSSSSHSSAPNNPSSSSSPSTYGSPADLPSTSAVTAEDAEAYRREEREDLERRHGPLRTVPDADVAQLYPGALSLPLDGGYIEVRRNLYLNPQVAYVQAALEYLAAPLRGRSVTVASLVDPESTDGKNIREHAGPRFEDTTASREALEALLTRHRGDIVILIAHSEYGDLVQTVGQGERRREVGRITADEAREIAGGRDVLLHIVTCRGAGTGVASGVLGDLYTPAVLAGLERIRKARDYGELYASFGSPANPSIIQNFERDMNRVLVDVGTRVGDRDVVVLSSDGAAGYGGVSDEPETLLILILLFLAASLGFGFCVYRMARAPRTPRVTLSFSIVCLGLMALFGLFAVSRAFFQ